MNLLNINHKDPLYRNGQKEERRTELDKILIRYSVLYQLHIYSQKLEYFCPLITNPCIRT